MSGAGRLTGTAAAVWHSATLAAASINLETDVKDGAGLSGIARIALDSFTRASSASAAAANSGLSDTQK